MKTRIITATILILVFGTILIIGEGDLAFLFSGGVILLATLANYEFMIRLNRANAERKWFDYLPMLFTFIFVLLNIIYFNHNQYTNILYYTVLAMMFVYLMIYLMTYQMTRNDIGVAILGIFYTSIGFIALAYLRSIHLNLILYLLMITILTDTFAYFIGIRFGKHRLMPKVSPKKSVEGAIGGLFFGGLFGGLFAVMMDLFSIRFLCVILISLSLSVVSQSGDLIASKFKREVGIKDYSNLFPGHGGILDRFDSTMFAAIALMLIWQVIS